ncbi:diguanylate cyclase [Noviherbaspirillum sp. UKPF54]|uniref:GGDEF domain-containing protein n=1 Tax=Noviherbaspirillum sp. UKPF54 TaxID=2601898 RepID=UPI0011B15945|nr:GGDEF domain-containing protein [Noviherbaspirillum sp. UKPF54]QDZ28964.1 GGDEF domain-containing protein [Noviherbaspirillum sp. UKPF54]
MTLISGIFLVSACLCILMLVVLSSHIRMDEPGATEWAAANAIGFVAFILYALGRQLPPLIAFEAANTAYAAAVMAMLAGFRRFAGGRLSPLAGATWLAIFTAAIALFHYRYDSFALRTITVSAFQSVVLAAIAVTVFGNRQARRLCYSCLLTGAVAALFGAGNGVRAMVHVFQSGEVTSLLQPSPSSIFFLSAGALVLPALTCGAMMMVHEHALAHAADAASRDFLTGAMTRHAFLERVEREWARPGKEFAVLMLEVDRLPLIRQTFGNAAGDQMMADIALRAESVLRSADCFARFDAQKFAVLLPQTGTPTALKIAQRLAARVERPEATAEFAPGQDETPTCTVSIGVAALGQGESIPDLLGHAQEALQAARTAGGNRVVCAGAAMQRQMARNAGRELTT